MWSTDVHHQQGFFLRLSHALPFHQLDRVDGERDGGKETGGQSSHRDASYQKTKKTIWTRHQCMSLSLPPLSEKKTKKKRMNALYSRGQRRERSERQRQEKTHALTHQRIETILTHIGQWMLPESGSFTTTGRFRKTDRFRNGSITTTGKYRKTDQFRKRIKSPTDQPSTTDQLMLSISSLTNHLSAQLRCPPLPLTTTRESLSIRRRWFVRFAIDNAWYAPPWPWPTPESSCETGREEIQLSPSSTKETGWRQSILSSRCTYPSINEEEEEEADVGSCMDWSMGCTTERGRGRETHINSYERKRKRKRRRDTHQ